MSHFCFNPAAQEAMYAVLDAKPVEDQTMIATGSMHPDILRSFGSVRSYPAGMKWMVANLDKSIPSDHITKRTPGGTHVEWDIIGGRTWEIMEGHLSVFDIAQELTDLANAALLEAHERAVITMAEIQALEDF
jgi:hypothetical protein